MSDDLDDQQERPLRERIFSWEEFKAGWRFVRGHATQDSEEEAS